MKRATNHTHKRHAVIRVVLVLLAVLFTALMWSGLSIKELLRIVF
jgi:hypothetical protein